MWKTVRSWIFGPSMSNADSHYQAFLDNEDTVRVVSDGKQRRVSYSRCKLGVSLAIAVIFLALAHVSLTCFLSQNSMSAFLNGKKLARARASWVESFRASVRRKSFAQADSWLEDDFRREFVSFTAIHKKNYDDSAEAERRFEIYKHNVQYINTFNKHQTGSYSLKMNQFGDITPEEFQKHHLGYIKNSLLSTRRTREGIAALVALNATVDLPKEIDWRDMNCVNPPKDQAQCGSCWAFSVAGALESATCAKLGYLPDLSEQQMVDCAGSFGNRGCSGGEMDYAFEYIVENGGLCSEAEYPYEATVSFCRSEFCKKVVAVIDYVDVPRDSVHMMRAALAKYGPVSVAINADPIPFQFYHDGVFSDVCGDTLDHAVLLIGYGVDPTTSMPFWIVKNSWGSTWGNAGYVKMARSVSDVHGECGILMDGSFPLVKEIEGAE